MTKEEFAKLDHHWAENLQSQRDNALAEIEKHKVTITEKDGFHEQKLHEILTQQGKDHEIWLAKFHANSQAELQAAQALAKQHFDSHAEVSKSAIELADAHAAVCKEHERIKPFEQKHAESQCEVVELRNLVREKDEAIYELQNEIKKLQSKIEQMEGHPEVVERRKRQAREELQFQVASLKAAEAKLAEMDAESGSEA